MLNFTRKKRFLRFSNVPLLPLPFLMHLALICQFVPLDSVLIICAVVVKGEMNDWKERKD